MKSLGVIPCFIVGSATALGAFVDDPSKNVFPNRAVGTVFYTEGSKTLHCTGALVGPDLIVTAPSCLMGEDGKWRGNVIFYPDMNGKVSAQPMGSRLVWAKYGILRMKVYEDIPRYWALARLQSRLGDTMGWLGWNNDPGLNVSQTHLAYPGIENDPDPDSPDFRKKENCTPTSWLSGIRALSATCSAAPGTQGAPLFRSDQSGAQLTGISLSRGANNYNTVVAAENFSKQIAELNAGNEGKATQTSLQLCNQSGHATIYVSLGEWRTNAWGAQGWWAVKNGGCLEMPLRGKTDGVVYLHAQDGATRWGGGDQSVSFCVDAVNAYDYQTQSLDSCSGGSKELRTFSYLAVKKDKINIFTFRP